MTMNIQIFGVNKCKDTQKAIRFFKERNIIVQFIDLTQKKISKGELESITRTIPLEKLINKGSNEYKKMNLQYIQHDIKEVLLENPLLFFTPIVRNKDKALIGYDPDLLKEWLK